VFLQLVNDHSKGGSAAANTGKLSFMIGHTKPEQSDSTGLRIQKVLTMMSDPEKCFWCGKIGAGLAAKISNNYISCTVFLVVAEALAIGVRSGIDPKLLQEVIHNSSGQTFMGDIISKAPSSQLKGGFPVNLMIKDVGLGVDVGNETGVIPRMALTALDIWKKSAEDPSIIYQDGFSNVD
jgi:3-hydroxyisobutyrate dehydrogenase-like beta-hydroxyacid dehydrogenase